MFLVGAQGFEPWTNGLKVRCATAAPYSRINNSIQQTTLFVNHIETHYRKLSMHNAVYGIRNVF